MKDNAIRGKGDTELIGDILAFGRSGILDVAYYQKHAEERGVQGENPLARLAAQHGSEIKTEDRYIPHDTPGHDSPYLVESTDALFLLPNGKYGNANEAGNYLIGYAVGYSGSNMNVAAMGQAWTRISQRRNDEPHEQALVKEGQSMGHMNYRIYWWDKYKDRGGMDQRAYDYLDKQYKSYKKNYSGNPLIKQ